jgi:phosphoglycerate kinase
MSVPAIESLELRGKRVFVRVDFNVPLEDGRVTDDSRIRASLPTIELAIERGARVVLASHLGRPKGQPKPEYSLEPAGARLSELLAREVILTDDCIGDGVRKVVGDMQDGQVVLLENLRFHAEEEANEENFARALASLAQVYVNDAFGAAHRAHASVAAMVKHVPERAMGLLLRRELEALSKLLAHAERPFLIVVGGAKVADKIGVLENLLAKADDVVIGGAMANTFLKARGGALGRSKLEDEKLPVARRFWERAQSKGVAVFLPTDLVTSADVKGAEGVHVRDASNVPADEMGLDIGPETRKLFLDRVRRAKTIFWNGPMGYFEQPPFDEGTRALSLAFAEASREGKLFSVAGGGDTVAALHMAGVADAISHVSTGGGASLELLEGKVLPGVAALEAR